MTQTDSQIRTPGLTGFHLKVIAAVTMLIDHLGAEIVTGPGCILFGYYVNYLRIIGRLSFPIYAFLMAEGVRHTRNPRKYLARILILAVVSEPIYDYYFNGSFFYLGNQNILFTMSLGILMLVICRKLSGNGMIFARLLVMAVAGIIAELLKLDYGFYGICLFWIFGEDVLTKWGQLICGALLQIAAWYTQIFAAFAMIPIAFYNGERGWRNKAFQIAFYVWYPAHLLVLTGLKVLIG